MSRRLLAVAAVLAMTLCSAFTLTSLVVPGLWLPRTLLVVGVAAVVATLVRSRSASAGIPSLVGLAAGLLVATAVFFPEEALLRVLPTQATIRAVVEMIPTTIEQMRSSYPPLSTGEGIAFIVAVGVLLVFVLADMLAVGAWAPAWSGLPMLGLWCIPVMLGAPVSALTFALAALTYVLVIAVQARDDARYRRRPDARAARATAIVTASVLVAAFVAAPTLLRIPVPVRWHPVYELVGSSSTRLDLGLGLREDLTRSTDVPLFTWTGAAPDEVGPFHAYTMSVFNGSTWERGSGGEMTPADGELLWPTPIDGVALDDSISIALDITDLGQDRLLLPGEPRVVDVDADADYLASSDEVVAHIGGAVSYDVTILPRLLDSSTLAGLRPATDVPPELLALPDTGYQTDIAELTREVVSEAGAQTPYEQLLAIQNYLRDPANFVYSTSIAAPQTPDAVWDFLNDRHGYCVQFATTMVVMARTLDMPSRLAVGFLPGTASADGVTEVTAHDAHAWPQVLFEGVGWVRFEPTPGVQAGDPPAYAPEPTSTASGSTPTSAVTTAAPPTDGATGATATATGTSGSGEDRGSRAPWLAVLAGLVAIAGLASVLATRRARLRGPDLMQRWDHVLVHLDRLGVDISDSQTPRAVVRQASDVLDAETWSALAALAAEVETASYGRSDAARASAEDVDRWVEQVTEGVRAALRAERAGV